MKDERPDVPLLLEQALSALEAHRGEKALSLLLEAWRAQRSVEVADRIDALSGALAEPVPDEGPVQWRQEAWLARAAQRSPASLGGLLSSLTSVVSTFAWNRLQALQKWPRDPRIARSLLALLDQPPYRSRKSLKFWIEAFLLISVNADARTAEALQGLTRTLQARFAGAEVTTSLEGLVSQALRQAARELSRCEPARPWPDGPRFDQALVGFVQARRAAADGHAAFLRTVYESPDEDGPRLVYADWLLERGDPRGEFIGLQFRRRAGDTSEAFREKKLLEAHQDDWLGPLARYLDRNGLVFERGFVTEGRVVRRSPSEVLCAGNPAWSTVRVLECGTFEQIVGLVVDPAMKSLRVLRRLPSTEALKLCRREEPLPLEELEIEVVGAQGSRFSKAFVEAVGDPRGLPHLRRLGITGTTFKPALYDWIWKNPIGSRLEAAALSSGEWHLDGWLAALASPVPKLARLDVLFREATATFTRGQDGRFSRLRLSLAGKRREGVFELAAGLERMPADALDAFVVDGGSGNQRKTLTDAARRQVRLGDARP